MKHNSNVPAFLTKLWTLVEDEDTNEFICWSQEGNSFLVLDEQRFAKEILPKFFKHNNMASFIRQLNMYGFRKVMHIDTGIVKQERDGPVEFQHPYFKHGQDDLLENIKRKVSNTRPEDTKIRQEDLSKILASVQSVHSKQENIDVRLATLKRENEALWREISDLRQKHAHQQQLIKKLIHFIVTLVQNNHILNLKRKRDVEIMEVELESCAVQPAETEVSTSCTADIKQAEAGGSAADDSQRSRTLDSSEPTSALQLNKPSVLSLEDPVKMMDSILNENGAISQNINLLGKVELMDYLDSIDCSLEDFQAMLYGKQFSMDFDPLEESLSSKENTAQLNRGRTEEHNTVQADSPSVLCSDKQLIQYTTCPLLAFLDGCTPPPELDLATSSSSTDCSAHLELSSSADARVEAEPPSELLDTSLELKQRPCSSLIRLEPLTEAEASAETLFYLCELSPAGPETREST
ncbi:heat shock factor protein 2 isoform X3 [Pagrus major]|uniref:heat shock factor protein 2 isoform X3 n=1 Tax=Pagrus major TaxID=143350 RepID=UPI003CC875E8